MQVCFLIVAQVICPSLGLPTKKEPITRHHISLEGPSRLRPEVSYAEDSINLLALLHKHKHCSLELKECLTAGPVRLDGNASCFALCLGPLVGCRSCCEEGECFETMGVFGPRGKCQPCSGTPVPSRSVASHECAPSFTVWLCCLLVAHLQK